MDLVYYILTDVYLKNGTTVLMYYSAKDTPTKGLLKQSCISSHLIVPADRDPVKVDTA